MTLNDEERDILAGKAGPMPQLALKHQIKVGEFFGAADFVPVTQAHIMADTESLGEAGVQWLEGLAATTDGQRKVRIPTIAESGYAGFETTAWWGVFAPAKLPDALTASLVAEIARITASDAFRGKLEPLGVTAVTGLSGAAFADFQKSEVEKWGKVVKDANVKID